MNAHARTATRIADREQQRAQAETNLAAALRDAGTHADRREALDLAAASLAKLEPRNLRPVAYCAVTVRRPEAGGTGVTVTVAEVGGAA